MERKTYTIDAAGKILGRLATKVAVLLRGKNSPDYVFYKDTGNFIIIKNIDKIIITGKKFEKKIYYHHSGFPGGIKGIPLKKKFQENPGKLFKKVVYGMLPKNRLRTKQIKRLKVE